MAEITQEELFKKRQERDKLFAIKDDDVLKLSRSDQYLRMRYAREVEAHEYIILLRKGWSYKEAAIQARKNADRIVQEWTENCSIWNLYSRTESWNQNKTNLPENQKSIEPNT